MPYYTLRADKGFLRGMKVGPDEDLQSDDIVDGQDWADGELNEKLGKTWADPVPPTIQKIAHLLGASYCLLIAHRNNQMANGLQYAEELETRGRALIAEILSGRRGIRHADGVWDAHYPGIRNREEGRGASGFSILAG